MVSKIIVLKCNYDPKNDLSGFIRSSAQKGKRWNIRRWKTEDWKFLKEFYNEISAGKGPDNKYKPYQKNKNKFHGNYFFPLLWIYL